MQVSIDKGSIIKGDGARVALMDYGIKQNIIRSLLNRGCEVYQFPASATSEEILAVNPDGIMLSNGPGDPKDCTHQIKTIKELMGKKPIFGICLGHQLTALAAGADTEKLKYGHQRLQSSCKGSGKGFDVYYLTESRLYNYRGQS